MLHTATAQWPYLLWTLEIYLGRCEMEEEEEEGGGRGGGLGVPGLGGLLEGALL